MYMTGKGPEQIKMVKSAEKSASKIKNQVNSFIEWHCFVNF